MPEPVTAPKGTYDILPQDQAVRRWVIAQAEEIFRLYGYSRIDTPTFEETRLFSRGVGESTDIVRKEMYTFEDLGGRSMTLRPEGTAPVARAYVEHGMHTLAQPVKLYYHSPMFRYESPQSGRYRQHHQLGLEAFGSDSPQLDAEVIGVLAALYARLGLQGLQLRLNSMGCSACRPGYSSALRMFLADHADNMCGECAERSRLNPMRTFDCKVDACRGVLAEAPRLPDHLCEDCSSHHAAVQACLDIQGIAYLHDHTLVRGMDYYTRTTFEFQSDLLGAQSGVGGGGRYDELVKDIGGPAVPGVGFGTGVERILLALAKSGVEVPGARGPGAYLVAFSDQARLRVFAIAHALRSQGVAVDVDHMGRSPKGQMKQAGKSGAAYALMLGDDELEAGTAVLRDLRTGDERVLPQDEAITLIQEAKDLP